MLLIHRASKTTPWLQSTEREHEIFGAWPVSADGDDVELRIQRKFVGVRMPLLVVNRNAATAEQMGLELDGCPGVTPLMNRVMIEQEA